jgi:hypothetical protein
VYKPVEIDTTAGILHCNYELDSRPFTEIISVGAGLEWGAAAEEAARLVGLLAGVSYYKAGAPPLIDLGETPIRPGEREFLRRYYLGGLGEFAYRNGLELDDIEIVGGADRSDTPEGRPGDAGALVPFGGGIDSIVVAELVAAQRRAALFVLNRPGVRFAAIESAAGATDLPVLRAEREIDQDLIQLGRTGEVFNGHVPITAVVSAVAVLVAALHGYSEVVMSNEWSASRPNIEFEGRSVNHQFSKSWGFERELRAVLARGVGPAVNWFSLLRPFSELWVARRFAQLTRYHRVVHSCNKAFYLDPAQRLNTWCGRCDKCCFIDLILSPYLGAEQLAGIFEGAEPLADPTLLPQFRVLLGLGEGVKPFECVGDIDECRAAAAIAAERPDRASNRVLTQLWDEMGPDAEVARDSAERLTTPLSDHAIPPDLLAAALA